MSIYRNRFTVPSREELLDKYSKPGATISSLAREYNTSQPTVRKWLIQNDIERKSHKQASTEANNRNRNSVKPTKSQLQQLYETCSIDEIERHFSVGQSTVYTWLDEYNIPIRSLSDSCKVAKEKQFKDIQFSREFLDRHYDREKSIGDLANKIGVSRTHARNLLIRNQIEIQPVEPTWRSKAEIGLHDFLVSCFPDDYWGHNDKSIISPFELDIVNYSKKIAVEYCGLYWHSEGSSGKKRNYHREKYLRCKEAGFQLITVFESDPMDKVKSLLLKKLGRTVKVGARKTTLKEIASREASAFHQRHHLHDAVGGSNHYGLFYNDELLMVASFGKNRFSKKHQYECTRITSHSNYTVVGGVSKLIKFFIKTQQPDSIVTFSDLRFGEGNVYLKCGFQRVVDSAPNYWYTEKYSPLLHSRVKFQKHKLQNLLEYYDPSKTEYENMLDNGWDRIWDCGNAKYEWMK